MSKQIASVIGVAIFAVIALAERAPAIESKLTTHSQKTLTDAQLNTIADVSFDGRDGTVVGFKRDRVQVDKGAELIRQIDGVRVVDVVLKPNPTPTQPSRFTLVMKDKRLRLSGVVPDEDSRQAILQAAKSTWPTYSIEPAITIDSNIVAVPKLKQGLKTFQAFAPVKQLELNWSNDGVKASGKVGQAATKQRVDQAFAKHYTGQSFENGLELTQQKPPSVGLAMSKGKVTLSGTVSQEEEKKALLKACQSTWPALTVVDQIQVDAQTQSLSNREALLSSVGQLSKVDQLMFKWTPSSVSVNGWLGTAEEKASLSEALTKQHTHVKDQTLVTPNAAEIKKAQKDINVFLRTKQISFETGSDVPTAATLGVLKQTATLLKQYPNTIIEVRGHTDNQGKPEDNQTLSQKRADAVVKQLGLADVKTHRLQSVGYGDTRPIRPNLTPNGRALNRRVVFKVKGAK